MLQNGSNHWLPYLTALSIIDMTNEVVPIDDLLQSRALSSGVFSSLTPPPSRFSGGVIWTPSRQNL